MWIVRGIIVCGAMTLLTMAVAWGTDTATTSASATVAATSTAPATPRALEPEEVVRNMFVAVLNRDPKALAECIVPNPESAILVEGEAVPLAGKAVIALRIAGMPMRRAKVGETINLPIRGRPVPLTFTEDFINADRQQIIPEGSPLPVAVIRVNGVWRADAGSLIAARKAARAARATATQRAGTRPAAE